MESNLTYRIDNKKIVYRIINQEGVILNLSEGIYFSLNKTGAFIWQELVRERPLAKILALLEARFAGVDKKTLLKDLCLLVKDLEKNHLIITGKK
jgi:hypothetical protein